MKTIPFLEDLLFGSEILFCPRSIINKPTVGLSDHKVNEFKMTQMERVLNDSQ
jgi:hypothetical protein